MFLGKRWADKTLVLNNIDKKFLVDNIGFAESLVRVVNGGVDYKHIQSLKANGKISYDAVFLGRFHPQKGIFDLIKIWRLVCDKKPDAKLCIIGSGSSLFLEKVRNLVKKNNLLSNVELVGLKLGDEKLLLLKSSRLFLCPSYYESFAIVIAEAMACGLPVVAYNLPIYEGIYGKNIVRVQLGNIHQFADAVITFLDDNNLRKTFGLDSEKFVDRYNWDKIVEEEYTLFIDDDG
ncbi:glycosyltransferase family 4 protein [Candidatus Bathyarchaeota archaeon]|nr:glycosyltransferase family 4 protein [Candidatus Bathyarchaeota archaeon]